MKLSKIIRAAAYAAIIAIPFAGAGWFLTGPAAGQETKEQTLRGGAALEQLKLNGQYDSALGAINQARFGVSLAENTPMGAAAWRAPNPAAGYDAYVTEEGVSIALNNRTYVSLSLRSLGYGHSLRSVGPGEVSGDKQTINIAREGGVQEWYVNGPDGLEQGFTLSEPPGSQSQGEPLRLTLQASEGWRAVASQDGRRVILRGAYDQAVEYSKLVARDNRGRNIPARLTVDDDMIVIEVQDGEAAYPLTIDPIFTLQQKLTAADGATFDHFGFAVALSADTLVVGAPFDKVGENSIQGSVYVFTRNGATWTQQQKLVADDGAAFANFGWSVALDGDTLAVGAYGDTIGGNTSQGSAYVFTRDGATWTQQQKLIANDGESPDRFGGSIAIDGDTIVVGAALDNIGSNLGQGSAYVFTRNGATWTQQQKLIANDGAAADHFGYAVAIDGDTLVIGADADKIGANTSQGSAYIYTLSGATWTQQQKLIANDGGLGDFFGHSVAIDGDTLVIGAYRDGPVAGSSHGSAYVFTRGGATWTQQQKLIADDGAAYEFFGWSVAIDGDNIVVGASEDDNGVFVDQGSAYVFTRNGATWTQQQKLIANDGEPQDSFGHAVAIDGGVLVASAAADKIGANSSQGSVYVFNLPTCPTLTFAPASLPNGVRLAQYQQSVTVSGGPGPYQFALGGGALPPGISLASSGLLSGLPTTLGSYQFTIIATDLITGCTGSQTYTLTITSCPVITIMPYYLPGGARGVAYNQTLTATGGVAPYTFTVSKNTPLPSGLTLSQNGVLSGTPTTWGVFDFTAHVRDANGCAGSQNYTLYIAFAGDGGEIESGVAPRPRRQ